MKGAPYSLTQKCKRFLPMAMHKWANDAHRLRELCERLARAPFEGTSRKDEQLSNGTFFERPVSLRDCPPSSFARGGTVR